MIVLHICPLSDDPCNGVHVAVPQHVKAQRRYADAALWNMGQPLTIEGLEQVFTAETLDDLPAPYRTPDLVVFHEFYIPRYLSVAKELKKRGIPYLILPHGALKKTAQQKSFLKKRAANLLLFRRFCNGAVGIQCLTEHEKNECVMGRNIFIAPNGVNPPPQTKTAFHKDSLQLVYVGRILPHIKGLDLMIDAFAKEKAFCAEHNVRLAIYGPADDRGVSYLEPMQKMIESGGVADIVTLHPEAVVGEEKQRVLLDADIFIQTSRTEGMPMGVLEALSYGLPCLLTEGTTFAVPVAAHGAGWNAGSTAESIAAALRQAVRDRESLSAFSQNALRYSRTFSWDSAAKIAVEQYRRCIGKD